ncbi:PepSY-associated TM helix domain-containing protein [Actinorugispora endophytica]|uniref:Putative iron-regulated membrane protein n=1 Tax=Actinorugispora endophytica TaxID=1605990 RepID=A0A4R6UY79_9ACTN|nr:PepSY-associated TM helix domain-containing protein [Actinorugispora endophytica]TDQ52260.1 putative iron-regulated membrane protein [Actinorugispora endophytica]
MPPEENAPQAVREQPDAPLGPDGEQSGREPGKASAWALLRPLVLRLHFYAGVLVAPFILVAAVTGLLYVYTPQLEQAVYADQLRVTAQGERIPLGEQVAAASAEHPEGVLSAVRPGDGPEDSTRVLFDVDGYPESFMLGVFVDPYTGEVLGSLDSYGSSGALPVRSWIDVLHRNLHLGDFGRLYSELAASWLWVVALGGVALWVGRRRSQARVRRVLAPEPGATGRRRTMSWHGSVGVWALLGLFALSATGLTWSTYAGENVTAVRAALDWRTPAVSTELPSGGSGATGVDVGVDRVLEAARAEGLDGPVEVVYPASAAEGYKVTQTRKQWPTQQDSVTVDPATGEVVDVVRFEDFPVMAKLSRWGVDVHMGLLFGLANQLALTALALAVVAMVFWGYRMWWQRRPTTGSGFAMGRPFPRGAWRRLPWWVKAATVVVAVGVGFLLPVLGVSLLFFLAVDVLVGAWHRGRARDGAIQGEKK